MDNCEKCYKFYNSVVSDKCNFCRDYSFNENILCDLLQEEYSSYEVKCSAFKPSLSVIGEANKKHDWTFGPDQQFENILQERTGEAGGSYERSGAKRGQESKIDQNHAVCQSPAWESADADRWV